jgi:hypothetical protein
MLKGGEFCMKRLIILFVALYIILGGVVFAVETTKTASDVSAFKSEAGPEKTEQAGIAAKEMEKETKMSATGKVTEISDTILKIDRHIKGNTEMMEFTLEKACSGISIGDKVKISYITKGDKNVAARVTKMQKKAKKHHTKKKAATKEEVEPVEEIKPTPAAE